MDRRLMLERAAENVAAWNRHDADAVVAYAVDDVIWRDVALPMPLHGREAVRQAARGYLNAFPDLRVEITSQTVEGPRVVQEWTAEAMHRGELMGLAPTSRAMRVFGATVITFDEDGRVIEGAVYWNPLGMLHQLGLTVPAPEQRAAA